MLILHFGIEAKMKDMGFLDMTKRERRGTIIVLAVIALLMACTFAVRYCHNEPSPDLQQNEMQKYESEADTSLLVFPAKPKKTHKSKKKTHKKHPPKSKPDNRPRHIDPVPQF